MICHYNAKMCLLHQCHHHYFTHINPHTYIYIRAKKLFTLSNRFSVTAPPFFPLLLLMV